jgi:hypothetical protein
VSGRSGTSSPPRKAVGVRHIKVAQILELAFRPILGDGRDVKPAGSAFTQLRGPLSSVTIAGGIFGGSCGPALALQSGHGMPGAPHWKARGDGQQPHIAMRLTDSERVVTALALHRH